MGLLGDVGHVGIQFGPFGDIVSVGARLVHGLEKVLVLVQDRSTDCPNVP
jgi:hypothetical protein